MRTPKADSMEAQKLFHVWEAIKAPSWPIRPTSGLRRADGMFSDGATLIASEDLSRGPHRRFPEDDRYILQHDDSAGPLSPAARYAQGRASRTATTVNIRGLAGHRRRHIRGQAGDVVAVLP
ncbi:MAG: hypothetical protein ACLSAH_14585 [Bilophila wadsworthia]